ncbi:ATPase SWSAP1 isoform X2 [Esox lucius]|uniref:ATPase SWSAP1 isoform X2 n=1 Tax=Esox lucius TaxID=8010 RepID=UPI0014773D3A|nr:ATPase SWSAP1 isoform X2 [Esox lucius]
MPAALVSPSQKIKFAYPRSLEDLLQDVASLHEAVSGSATAPTSLIIVDGLECYLRMPGLSSGLQQAQLSSAAHVSALLFDTAAFLTQTLEERAASLAPCRVLASFQPVGEGHARDPSAQDPVISVLDRYFQVRCTLDRRWQPSPAAAGPQDMWHVCLCGVGITGAFLAEDEENPGRPQEWTLVIGADGSMEFTPV